MGMYTELVLKCEIKDDVPAYVKDVLKYLFKSGDEPQMLPKHAFFECPRWPMVGRSGSFYHHPNPVSDYWTGHEGADNRGGQIFSRSDLKNYNDELTKFLDWLMPYIDQPDGACIGWTWYEEDDKPTLIYKTGESLGNH